MSVYCSLRHNVLPDGFLYTTSCWNKNNAGILNVERLLKQALAQLRSSKLNTESLHKLVGSKWSSY